MGEADGGRCLFDNRGCRRKSQSTVVLCIGWTRSWPIMPVHLKFRIYAFTFSDNPLLTPQDDS